MLMKGRYRHRSEYIPMTDLEKKTKEEQLGIYNVWEILILLLSTLLNILGVKCVTKQHHLGCRRDGKKNLELKKIDI